MIIPLCFPTLNVTWNFCLLTVCSAWTRAFNFLHCIIKHPMIWNLNYTSLDEKGCVQICCKMWLFKRKLCCDRRKPRISWSIQCWKLNQGLTKGEDEIFSSQHPSSSIQRQHEKNNLILKLRPERRCCACMRVGFPFFFASLSHRIVGEGKFSEWKTHAFGSRSGVAYVL